MSQCKRITSFAYSIVSMSVFLFTLIFKKTQEELIFKYWHFLCPTHFFLSNYIKRGRNVQFKRVRAMPKQKKASFGRHIQKINSWGNTEEIKGTLCQGQKGRHLNRWDLQMQNLLLHHQHQGPMGSQLICFDHQMQNFYWLWPCCHNTRQGQKGVGHVSPRALGKTHWDINGVWADFMGLS